MSAASILLVSSAVVIVEAANSAVRFLPIAEGSAQALSAVRAEEIRCSSQPTLGIVTVRNIARKCHGVAEQQHSRQTVRCGSDDQTGRSERTRRTLDVTRSIRVEPTPTCPRGACVVTESPPSEPSGWRRHWNWAKWLFAAALLGFVLWRHRAGLSQITQQPLHWPSLATAIALCGGAIVLTFLRWFVLVKALDFPFTVRDALRLGFIGYLFNFVAPGSVGGDVVKAGLLAKEQSNRRTTAVATVLLDRILGMLALFLTGACAAWPQWPEIRQTPQLKAVVGLLVIGSAAGLVGLLLMLVPAVTRSRAWQHLARLPVVGHMVAELVDGVRLYQSRPHVLFLALAISLVGHIGMISSFYFSAKAISGESFVPGYAQHLFFIPAAELAGIIPLTPGGVGLLEEAVNALYKLNGAADGTGILTCLAYRAVTLAIALIGAAYYLTSRREVDQAMHEQPS